MKVAQDLYISGKYGDQHEGWHIADSPYKAKDILPNLKIAAQNSQTGSLKIAEIGAGVGGVLSECTKQLSSHFPLVKTEAVQKGRELFSNLEFRQEFFNGSDSSFDVTMFIDVLEHVENPWELLRNACSCSKYLIVHQPLLESFATFRHQNYCNQREEWGHIGYFNYYSFIDMAVATGWEPLNIRLLPPWELSSARVKKPSILHTALVKWNRVLASQFISGFYLSGIFKQRDNIKDFL
jgi:hypothetical protein